jgi:hypothetical protein
VFQTAHGMKGPQPDPRRDFCGTGEHRPHVGFTAVDRVLSARQVLNGTARIARLAQTEVVSNEKPPESLSNVKPGDVLVSHATAVREHEISVIPNAPHAISPTHDAAVSDGRSEADAMGVDAWLTEDHTHVVKIAANRPPDK